MAKSLRLPDDLSSRLENLVRRTGRTKAYCTIEAIRQHFDDLKDLYITEQRSINIRTGRRKTHSLEEADGAIQKTLSSANPHHTYPLRRKNQHLSRARQKVPAGVGGLVGVFVGGDQKHPPCG